MIVKPEYSKQHTSTKIWRAFYNYIKLHYDEKIFFDSCYELGVDPDFLLDDDNWLSNHFTNDFISTLITRTGDQDLSKNVGRETLTPENINSFEIAILKSLGVLFFLLN